VLSQITAWVSGALELALLLRSVRIGTLRVYPFFFAYLASTLTGVAVPVISIVAPRSYPEWYWPIQFLTLTFGCGIIFEILNHVLRFYPGPQKLAAALAIIAFCGATFLGVFFSIMSTGWAVTEVMVVLERDLRTVQALLLVGILLLISYYGIPVGKNMRGMISGYGIYVGTSLFALAAGAYAGTRLEKIWIFAPVAAFITSLAVWLTALWTYHPDPIPGDSIQIEADYEALASHTRRALSATRSYLGRIGRV
jgi:hypothetical protein